MISSEQQRIRGWIERDIAQRSLRAGDQYLTASEVASVLGVSRATADRAMKSLASVEVLVRKQRSGTFVGPRFSETRDGREATLRSIHILLTEDYFRSGVAGGGVLVQAMQRAHANSAVQMHFMPQRDSAAYVTGMVDRIQQDGSMDEGVVLIRTPREVQLIIEQSRLPAVVFGTPYPDVVSLPSIDIDHAAAGELAAAHALEQGQRRFILLTYEHWRVGDNLLHAGVTRRLGAAGVPMEQLAVISAAMEPGAVDAHLREILDADDEPTAIICRHDWFADQALRAAERCGRRDVIIISAQSGDGPAPYARVVGGMDQGVQAAWIGEALQHMAGCDLARSSSMRVPVELRRPDDDDVPTPATDPVDGAVMV